MLHIETISISSNFHKNLFKIILDFFPSKNQEVSFENYTKDSEYLHDTYSNSNFKNKKIRMILFLDDFNKMDFIKDLKEKNMTNFLMKSNSNNITLRHFYECVFKEFDIEMAEIL